MPTHTRKHPDADLPPEDVLALSETCAALDAAGLLKPQRGHRALVELANNGAFRCHKRNSRWHIRWIDLPTIAASYAAKSGDAGTP